jgi:hypothetical protein
MLLRVALVRTDVSEELRSSTIRVTRIGELAPEVFLRSVRRLLVTASVVPISPILVTLMNKALSSSDVFLRSVRQLLVTDSVVPISLILVTLKKEALSSSKTSVLTRATRRNIAEDTLLEKQEIS